MSAPGSHHRYQPACDHPSLAEIALPKCQPEGQIERGVQQRRLGLNPTTLYVSFNRQRAFIFVTDVTAGGRRQSATFLHRKDVQ